MVARICRDFSSYCGVGAPVVREADGRFLEKRAHFGFPSSKVVENFYW